MRPGIRLLVGPLDFHWHFFCSGLREFFCNSQGDSWELTGTRVTIIDKSNQALKREKAKKIKSAVEEGEVKEEEVEGGDAGEGEVEEREDVVPGPPVLLGVPEILVEEVPEKLGTASGGEHTETQAFEGEAKMPDERN